LLKFYQLYTLFGKKTVFLNVAEGGSWNNHKTSDR